MLLRRDAAVRLFVDRTSQQWIVRDGEGRLWIVPVGDEPWRRRQPFEPVADTDLEPVPGHYKSTLGLPF